jgi:exodeoxyribonuclease VII large subunit
MQEMNRERTFTIREISTGIQRALASVFPEKVWVVGEIQGLDRARHGKHWYFQLCESADAGEVYRLSATLWKGIRDKLFGPGGKLRGVINVEEPLDGIKIRALCNLDFYPPYGKISLHVQDIDPAYTLGDLEAKRQALIEKLMKAGTLHRNRETDLAEVPLRLGLITSAGSAAYNDFMKELEHSGIGFHVMLCDARMQGEESIPTIRGAFAALLKQMPDALVLIRGGGSRLDLSWFDREELVQTLIRCPVPVITGIGHEIDVTVCEMAAHTGLKTPTAAAAFLVERIRDYLEAVHETGAELMRAAGELLGQEETSWRRQAERTVARVSLILADELGKLRDWPRRLAAQAGLLAAAARNRLSSLVGRLAAGAYTRRLENLRMDLARAGLNLGHAWNRRHQAETHRLDLMEERCRLLDPARTLERGYSLLRDKEGKAVKSVEALKASDPFTAVLRDGTISAHVDKIEKEEGHGQKEKRQLEIW